MNPQIQQLVEFFIANGTRWVRAQHERYRPVALPLAPQIRDALTGFFADSTLDTVRIVEMPEIENPDFYSAFTQAGQPIPLDFRQMAGITFGDVVLISQAHAPTGEPITSLMFHELVHVAQYSILGVDEFIRRYVHGWASAGFDYYKIPLELHAYALQNQFERGLAPSGVESEVARLLAIDAPAP